MMNLFWKFGGLILSIVLGIFTLFKNEKDLNDKVNEAVEKRLGK